MTCSLRPALFLFVLPAASVGLAFGLTAPAGAQVGVNYCSPEANSSGSPALLSAMGSANVNLNDVTLECRQLPPGSNGYFLAALARGFVPLAGGSSGNLCLGGHIGRYVTPVLTAGADGTVALPLDLTSVPSPVGPFAVAPGSTVAFQYWHRDSGTQGLTSNFSDGLAIPFTARTAIGTGFFPGAVFRPGNSIHWSLATGDLNGDGLVDLATVRAFGRNVRVFFGQGEARFGPVLSLPAGRSTSEVRFGDMDGDGDLDIVTANREFGTVSVIRNLGAGTFSTQVEFATGPNPRGLALGDVDGDGDIDVVTADSEPGADTVSILINDGAGTLAAPATLVSQGEPLSVVLADLDDDGDLDIVAGSRVGFLIHSFLNDGAGNFSAPIVSTSSAKHGQMAAADFDQDGNLDLVLGDWDSGNAKIKFGDGTGFFPSTLTIPTPSAVYSVLPVDVNEDGYLDLVLGGGPLSGQNWPDGTSRTWLSYGDGNGQFGALSTLDGDNNCYRAAALELDGRPGLELVTLGRFVVHVISASAPGQFESAHRYESGAPRPIAAALADLNHDGLDDVLSVADYIDEISVCLGRADGTFGPPALAGIPSGSPDPGSMELATADFNGDGHLDFVTTSTGLGGAIDLFLGDGSGTVFSLVQVSGGGPEDTGVEAGDLNGDGDVDMVVAQGNGSAPTGLQLFANNGVGGFSSPVFLPLPDRPGQFRLHDLDQDGDLDAVVAVDGGNLDLLVFVNDGFGFSAPPLTISVAQFIEVIIFVDLDGDGDEEIVIGTSDGIQIRENLGGLNYGPAIVLGFPYFGATTMAAGDVDRDGVMDLVVGISSTVALFLGNGDLTFDAPTEYFGGVGIRKLFIRDQDDDGRPDVVTSSSRYLRVLQGLGR